VVFVGRSEVVCACVCVYVFVSNRQDVYRSGCSGSIRKVTRSYKPYSEVNNLHFFSNLEYCSKVRVFQCVKM
jgi:hypothetical protein